ncbi:hypothetical protein PybrP1_008209 [[Pythium] brassicae (nom. inval.)]|nr:hypothetical protein PybrP1_008209 [[Pythium] brassicae (nom. inval.)]
MAQSWFADPELLHTSLSVSYVCNNLSKAGDSLVYAHADDAVVVSLAQSPCVANKLPITEKSFVHQVRLCALQDALVIVVASGTGVQIFDAKGEQSLYELGLKDALDTPEEGTAVFCRGIAAINSRQPSLVVGTSVGKLLVIGKEKAAKATAAPEFDLLETLREHTNAAITGVEASPAGALLATSDDSGLLLVRRPDDNFDVAHRVESDAGYPITAMRFVLDKWLVCGYLTGALRVYAADTLQLHAEVAAHSRAITALDALEGYVASVGEDTFLNIWELAGGHVRLASSHAVPNDLLAGVAFAAPRSVITAAYDTSHLKLWVPE